MIALPTPQATHDIGQALAGLLRVGDVVALTGPLGAGKTSLARGLLAGLGLAGEAPSPTYAIVQPYDPPDVRLPVWHVDLYRLAHPDEAEELGLADARADAALLVEWPERLPDRWWREALRLSLAPTAEGGRALTWQVPPAWEGRWPLT